MFISKEKTESIIRLSEEGCAEIYINGLYLSSKSFLADAVISSGINIILMPDKESAEYMASDIYNIRKSDSVYLLPTSGARLEKSARKATFSVQRTAAISAIVDYSRGIFPEGGLVIVTYPDAIEEEFVDKGEVRQAVITLKKGEDISLESLKENLLSHGFSKTDFVSVPGEFALRGGIIDIFSFSNNLPYRIGLFGDEIESIRVFDTNTQLSTDTVDSVEIFPDISASNETYVKKCGFFSFIPKDTVLWIDTVEIFRDKPYYSFFKNFKRRFIGATAELPMENVPKIQFNISPQPSFNKNFELLTEDLKKRMDHGYHIYILSDKPAQVERLKNIFYTFNVRNIDFSAGFTVQNGFIDHDSKVCCYTDHEIFDRFHRVVPRRTVEMSESLTINDLTSFKIGDYVVHIDHGIGIYGGLVKVNMNGKMQEMVKLVYKDNDVVFVSVHSLHKISRYKSSQTEDKPKINKIGSKTWQNLKTSAKSKLKDIAKDLIDLYAKRRQAKGFAYSADTYMQQELESSFIYEDTPDQEKATKAVKADMEEAYPMDRLVCGDVGFGKTEVAIRAAFKAVADSKQVAVLVPTTILAFQHFNTFSARLKNFPCTIDYLSRMRTAKETKTVLENLANGKTDIIIGTHKLLGKEVKFKDLGLLIIDEEQKFGVAAKEKLKQLKINVDTLTLTATPIPRTLQFSLLGARDLSIINTPPANRIPVRTEIMNFSAEAVRDIINYELDRGGQIFFVHNKIEELPGIAAIIKGVVPDAEICIGHGQMEAKELEEKVLDFMKGRYDILLCTTIISNGIDIPNANTIIINQAQNFGLSDLHQLRGRVGRSNRQAYCYLIVPPLVSVSDEARRRLKAIEAFSELGSGFNIAMQDLDIRGAGNLLGAQQSGFISDMGFETYQKILTEAMEELGYETGNVIKREDDNYLSDCTIETDMQLFIPDSYISMQAEKIRLYKELDSMTSERAVEKFKKEISDRFGPVPEELEQLINVVKIRIVAVYLGFEKLIIKNGVMIAHFISNPMSPYYKSSRFEKVIKYIQDHPALFKLKDNNGHLYISVRNVENMDKAYEILCAMRND